MLYNEFLRAYFNLEILTLLARHIFRSLTSKIGYLAGKPFRRQVAVDGRDFKSAENCAHPQSFLVVNFIPEVR